MTLPEPRPRQVLSLFYRLHRAKHNATLAALAQAGLQDVGQPRILFLLGEEGADGTLPSQQELAEKLHVSPATIANSLASLERMGYVARREDAQDRRKKRIVLTDKGRTARRACLEVFEQVDEQLCQGFSQQELDALSAQFLRMLDNLRELAGEDPCAHTTTGKDDSK